MRRIGAFFAAVLLVFDLASTVYAVQAPSMSTTVNMSSDGSCQVNLGLQLRLEQPTSEISFPLPGGATSIRVNGERVSTYKDGDNLRVDLSKVLSGLTGDITLNIQYDLYGLVSETEIGTLELRLPLLSGFEYAIDSLQFSVNLPGEVKSLPAFSSGYHQAAIEQHLTYTVNGNTVGGSSIKAMKDHETLVMTLPVSETMFPRMVKEGQSTLTAQLGIAICAGVALLYWLLFLRAYPRGKRCSEPPVGFSAGQVSCIVGNGGIDLTMTVFTWAQLGYVLIQPKREKVLLHKRMDMGNERSEYEQKAFRKLFGSRQMVDATGSRYANLAAALSGRHAGVGELFRKHTGLPLVFRLLCVGIGGFGGGGIGAVMGHGGALHAFVTVVFCILGAISGWVIPGWTDSGLFRRKSKLLWGWGLGLGWLFLAGLSGCFLLGLSMAAGLLIFGLLYGWSGRRTELGKQTAAQFLGLRRYLKGKDKDQLNRACDNDPDYFFRLAPYALALGVGKAFAKAVSRERLERCPYLTSGMDGHMNALQWYQVLAQTADIMDARKKRRLIEKIMKFFNSFTRP